MTAGTGVFVLTEAKALVAMQTAAFASEDDFQDLLARFPALLAGDQIDSVNPRRFILIDREQPIACEAGGAGRWSLDHLFLDQDGIPTLVEVKRGTDTRIRREVVGQMMDYAANAVRYWPAQALRDRFNARCDKESKSAIEVFSEQFGADQDFEAFWAKVATNLAMGRIRMLFVADCIPPELRAVVEFLNAQMRPAEVLAIELRQYQGQGLRTLVPIVLGQTQEAIEQKSGGSAVKPRRQWDEAQFLEALSERRDPAVVETAKAVIAWANSNADRVLFNDAPSVGAIAPYFETDSGSCQPIRLWTDGSFAIGFDRLKRTTAFSTVTARQELVERFNAIPGMAIPADGVEKQAYIRFASLSPDRGAAFLKIMGWVVEQLRNKMPAAA